MRLTVADIFRRLGLDPEKATNPETEISVLLTDSRSLTRPAESLFFAIRTRGNDGHRFISELYGKGVRNFVVREIPEEMKGASDANFIVVDSPTEALQTIARRADGSGGVLAAIAGSRGKTTLKEFLFCLLEPLRNVARSPRSFNSQIGVPLSLWEIADDSEVSLIEAGISQPGEMEALAAAIRPDAVIFTNLNEEHSEGFESMHQKASEKALLAAAPQVKTVIYPADSEILSKAIKEAANPGSRLIDWSKRDPQAALFINEVLSSDAGTAITYTFEGETSVVRTPLRDARDTECAIAALAFMLSLGIDREVIADRFSYLRPIRTRLNVSEGVNGSSLIFDGYTSDLSSLRQAIDFMRRRRSPDQPPTLILSDLRHEAEGNSDTYRAIAELLKWGGIKRFIGIGPRLSAHAAIFPENSEFYLSTADFLQKRSTSDFDHELILIKGAPEFEFDRILENLETRKHETVLEVNLDSLVSNYNYFRQQIPPSVGMIAMVKASGYGAGSYEIAKTLQAQGAAYMAVAVLDEGVDLRKAGITMPIMVMNPKVVNYRSMFAYRLEPEIYSMQMLRDVIREARKNGLTGYPVHIKLDTGMHRMGFTEPELPELMDMLEGQKAVEARSVFSHLATSDCPDMDDYTLLQLERFRRYTDYILQRSSYPILRHVLNSAGILRFPEHHYDMVRLGIGLYGANTLPPEMEKPLAVVSTLRTVIIAIREWEAGETIGYGRRGVLSRRSRIATIPIGYADGMNRHFGRGAIRVMINGKPAPTIGNICMDACMIDVTDVPCEVGDYVEIFGPNAPLQRLADTLDTIPYEILTSVSPRVKRVYYRE